MPDRPTQTRRKICRQSWFVGLAWALLVPFLALSIVAKGTMASAGEDGGLVMVICTGDALVEVVLTADGKVTPVQDNRLSHPCDWSLHAQPALDMGALPVPAPRQAELPAYLPIRDGLHARRASVLAPSARGPPSA